MQINKEFMIYLFVLKKSEEFMFWVIFEALKKKLMNFFWATLEKSVESADKTIKYKTI